MLTPITINGERAAGEPELITCTNRDAWRAAYFIVPYIAKNIGPAHSHRLANGGTLENVQLIAAHDSPRSTKLYDRTDDEVTLDEVERIAI